MIPFKDDNPTDRFPFVTIIIIGMNVLVFLLQFLNPSGPQRIAYSYGAIPHYLLTLNTVQPVHPIVTVFTSMFMHGGLLHIASNMLFLWIFGNNIEDKLGYAKFTLFYLLCGFAAAYSHALTNPASMLPMIGASGAVSGVLGAYLILFPNARVHTLVFLGFFVQVIRLPAVIVIGFWILLQVINGMLTQEAASQGGIAWFAHVGGFITGIILILILYRKRKRRRN